MILIANILNLPWSLGTLCAAVLSGPRRVRIHHLPFAVIVDVRSFWWYRWLPANRSCRAMTQGAVILLGPRLLPQDLEHELVHIEQCARTPFIQPFLYGLAALKHGHTPQNKYEHEAYERTQSTYLGR